VHGPQQLRCLRAALGMQICQRFALNLFTMRPISALHDGYA